MTDRMPAAFLGHGNPMNALEPNRWTEAWSAFGASVPRPRAVLAISAHWYTNATLVTAMERPRTIHDFYGFPDELFAVEYPAPGAPDVADLVVETLAPTWVGLDVDQWGIDHGTWSLLVHVFPNADVPVLQLAIDSRQPAEFHFDLGTRLAPLREQGVLVLSSGNVVHNLGMIKWGRHEEGDDWAVRFDDAARDIMTTRPEDALELLRHPDYLLASPTPDHFLPLLHTAGLAAAAGTTADVVVAGCDLGSLSMTSYRVD